MEHVFKYILSEYLSDEEKKKILSVQTPEEFDIAILVGINLRYDDDYTLRWASRNGHLPVVEFLVTKGINLHVYNDYAFRYASYYGHLHVVEFLVNKGADIHANNDCALKWASETGRLPIVEFLVKGLIYILIVMHLDLQVLMVIIL